jgi:demethylmenaquinone methyltransferase/2-methoxy-6-polyprenyl-1,4-benzoquinol methylase
MVFELSRQVLDDQIEYYRARAAEYDEWFLRLGRYDRGRESNELWFDEIGDLKRALADLQPSGSILEIAAGTGWWSEQLVPSAGHLTVLDSSAEALALNRARLGADSRVDWIQADVFEWEPATKYDVVFFSFWLSHVPDELFESFWARIDLALKPSGRVFFIDSLRAESSTASNHTLPASDEAITLRKLNDGREYRVVKIFYDPKTLESRLRSLGWQASVGQTETFFLYGSAER